MTAPNPSKVTMMWADWNLLVNVPLIAASRDDTLPLLCGVLVRRRPDGRLYGQATDRYRLITTRLPKTVKTAKSFPALLLPRVFIDRINRVARTTLKDRRDMTVTLVIRAGVVIVTVESGKVDATLRHRLDDKWTADKYPPLDRLHKDAFDAQTADLPAATAAFNSHYLGDIERVAKAAATDPYPEAVRVQITDSYKPALFRIGADVLYLLVPVRVGLALEADPWNLDLDGEAKK